MAGLHQKENTCSLLEMFYNIPSCRLLSNRHRGIIKHFRVRSLTASRSGCMINLMKYRLALSRFAARYSSAAESVSDLARRAALFLRVVGNCVISDGLYGTQRNNGMSTISRFRCGQLVRCHRSTRALTEPALRAISPTRLLSPDCAQ